MLSIPAGGSGGCGRDRRLLGVDAGRDGGGLLLLLQVGPAGEGGDGALFPEGARSFLRLAHRGSHATPGHLYLIVVLGRDLRVRP